jgi:NAD(P)-dependent dehydrogenase (short-subunit alcohol dehydrogenase family)
MQLPGERALFSQLSLRFRESCPLLTLPFAYRARVVGFDKRFDLLDVSAELSCGGAAIAQATLSSFIRADSPTVRFESLTGCLPPSMALRGRLALVIGGSRGLGAALVAALASQGCDVLLNYRSSREEAEALASALRGVAGTVSLAQGDASDPSWCRAWRRMLTERGGLDILICNAIPPIRMLGFALDSLSRFRNYVDESLALVITPLAAFYDLLESREGRVVIISSAYASAEIGASPSDLHHYVAAKSGVEGVARSLAGQAKRAHFLIARPPRLLTDMTNTPTGRQDALPVEGAAATIVKRLCESRTPCPFEILDLFGTKPESHAFPAG